MDISPCFNQNNFCYFLITSLDDESGPVALKRTHSKFTFKSRHLLRKEEKLKMVKYLSLDGIYMPSGNRSRNRAVVWADSLIKALEALQAWASLGVKSRNLNSDIKLMSFSREATIPRIDLSDFSICILGYSRNRLISFDCIQNENVSLQFLIR